MRGAISGNPRLAGCSETAEPDWLSIPQILEGLKMAECHVSERQLERWREAKLLPAGVQQFDQAGRGSIYRFPPETVELAVAIEKLKAEKNDLVWIGWELWWRGHPAPQECWRPKLLKLAERYDPILRRLARIVRRERNGEGSTDSTLADRVAPNFVARKSVSKFISSRITRRVSPMNLPTVIRIILDAASGISPDYEPAPEPDEIPADQHQLFKAFDLGAMRTDRLTGDERFIDDEIEGHRLELREALPRVLDDIAAGIQHGSLVEAANALRGELEAARDDIRSAKEIVEALHRATSWIYGDKAFGLRFANWVAVKTSTKLLHLYLLIWVLVRRASGSFYSSEEIRKLHVQTIKMADDSEFLKELSDKSGELSDVLNKNNIRAVLTGKIPFKEFAHRVNSAKLKSKCEASDVDRKG